MPSTHCGIMLHVVFSTKYRAELIQPSWQNDLYSVMGGIARDHRATLIRAGGVKDHVHLLLKTHPSFAISDTIKMIKGNASHWVNCQAKLAKRFAWQKGYGAFSISESMMLVVKRYIDQQELHHRKKTFQNEYLELLMKHKVSFDKRYVFDDEHCT